MDGDYECVCLEGYVKLDQNSRYSSCEGCYNYYCIIIIYIPSHYNTLLFYLFFSLKGVWHDDVHAFNYPVNPDGCSYYYLWPSFLWSQINMTSLGRDFPVMIPNLTKHVIISF